jgi:hypothetical protein
MPLTKNKPKTRRYKKKNYTSATRSLMYFFYEKKYDMYEIKV